MAEKILVIDDELDMRVYVSTLLETSGYVPLTAEDGEEGLALAQSERPSLIILDILMPKMSGLMLFHGLRKDQEMKDIPVIILSAISKKSFMHSLKTLTRQAGDQFREPSAYIEKPPEPEDLLEAIQT
ncbi:MAG: response regulator, partial [Deltaproteobacteria bacterium]|nr:response regulator [Deltaproteobacteria bacterium]